MKKLRTIKTLGALALTAALLAGCTVVSANRTFPKLSWYWSPDAKAQRAERKQERQAAAEYSRTNTPAQ